MAEKIRWSRNAINNYNVVVSYLLENWNEEIAGRFIEVVENKVEQISRQPYIGVACSYDTTIRSVLITKHNRLYYRVEKDSIELVNIFDTRMDPVRNPNRYLENKFGQFRFA
jgi:plasmid stabilization system protein ParE